MNRKAFTAAMAAVLLIVAALPPATLAAGDTGSAKAHFTKGGVYIVQLADLPVVVYDGSVKGYKATAPNAGKKIDPNATDVVRYAGYLTGKHDAALKSVGGATKLYSYVYAYNGFAAKLTAGQANKLAAADGVVAIAPDQLREVDTSSTPTFLGLDATDGLWDMLGGVDRAGEGIIIGVVDSGIWPESLSFSDRTGLNGNATKDGKLSFQQIPGWHGKCTPGEGWNASNCNQKLIGAQYFNASWGGSAAVEAERPWEFQSTRDYNGHGTHTSSTAGGNHGVTATGPAAVFGTISGMAPRARVAMYKALWSTQDASTASGFTGDLVAAIDTAVHDGVDVINYSISGSRTSFLDAAEVSFLFAAAAGVFVAASAGNSGPTTATVAHPSPWITTVAAGTHNRSGQGSATLGNGTTYFGASLATAVGPVPLVDSTTAGLAGAPQAEVDLCYPGRLDPADVAGKIVVCDRGVIARVDKSLAVAIAGGVGMILLNTSVSSLNADFHFVPTVHLQDTDKAAVDAYAATAGATATINAATITFADPAPFTAAFSSRGPLQAGGGDLLKPDVIAPGQDILAAVAPPGSAGRDFNLFSGTSMSSPHVAGLAALLKDLHPNWSPAAIKSALMTTGFDVLDSSGASRIFRQGAGHVAPNWAADPGLVFPAGFNDWRGFLRSQKLCTFCFGSSPAPVFDPSDLNGASIAIGDLAGVQTVTRRVTNVGGGPATYDASVSGMSGITTVVSPASFSINPGETKSFTVTFTAAGAALNAYTGGQLTWSDGSHSVRVPMVVRPVALAAPASVSGTGGQIDYSVTFGYTGAFSATARGLVPAATESRTVVDDQTDGACSLTTPNAQLHSVVVPAGSTYARFSLFDAFTDGNDDLDLCVFLGAANKGSSGSGTSAEEVNLVNPDPGTYTVVVQGWGTDGPDAQYTLFSWVLGSTDAGNMVVSAPASATLGSTGTISLTFSGLAAATKYLGSVAYGGIAGLPNPTIVRVDTP